MTIIFDLDELCDIGVAFASFMARGREKDKAILVELLRPHRHHRFRCRGFVFWLAHEDGSDGDKIEFMTTKEYDMERTEG